MTDPTVENLKARFDDRSRNGIKKYGTTMDGNKLPLRDWLEHALEESMDLCLYLQRAIEELDRNN